MVDNRQQSNAAGRHPAGLHNEAQIVFDRERVGGPRHDGRDTRFVRPMRVRHAVLPRWHGSALAALCLLVR